MLVSTHVGSALAGVKVSFLLILDVSPLANTEVGYYG
jgi:hypothetical protein